MNAVRSFNGVERAAVVGHSMGGMLAVRYALDYSEFYKPEDTGYARALVSEARNRTS